MNEQPEGVAPSEESSERTDRPREAVREPSHQEVALMIAERLGETEKGPRIGLKRIVKVLGRTQARALLEETLQIEEQGGIPVPDGSRRRTPGGVFFYLAHTKGQPKPGQTLAHTPRVSSTSGKSADRPPAPFTWAERIAVIDEIRQSAIGRASTVKITVVGTLGKYVDKGSCIVGMMQHSGEKLPALPKGVPAPQAVKTNYVVYIGSKQWKNVAATVSDPEDALIVEGFPQVDPKTGAISVFVSSVTSKKIQAGKRQKEGS